MPLLLLLIACILPTAEVINANAPDHDSAPVFREVVPFSAVITVQNPYDRAVKVARLDTTCSCSKLELATRFLLPGEKTTLAIGASNLRRSGKQQVRVSLFLSDPDFDPIEVWARWHVRPAVAVDLIEAGRPSLERPADDAWRDIYRLVADERPDEPKRLRKRIRLSCPPEESPPGGLRVEGIDYAGSLWRFETRQQENGSILVVATSADQQGPLKEGEYAESFTIRTNHPDKPRIEMRIDARISKDAGRVAVDPMQALMPPGP